MSANVMASLLPPAHAALNREPHLPQSDPAQGSAFESLLADLPSPNAPISPAKGDENAGSQTQRTAAPADLGNPPPSSPKPTANVDAALAVLTAVVFASGTPATPQNTPPSQSATPRGPAPAVSPTSARRMATAGSVFASVARFSETLENAGSVEPTTPGASAATRTPPSAVVAWPSRSNANVKMPDLSSLINAASLGALPATDASAIMGPDSATAKAAPGAALGALAFVRTNSLDFAPELGFQSLQTRTHLAVSGVESSAASFAPEHSSVDAGAVSSPDVAPPVQTQRRQTQFTSAEAAPVASPRRQGQSEPGAANAIAPVKESPGQPRSPATEAAALVAGLPRQANVASVGATNAVSPAQASPRQMQSFPVEAAPGTGLPLQANVGADAASVLPAPTPPPRPSQSARFEGAALPNVGRPANVTAAAAPPAAAIPVAGAQPSARNAGSAAIATREVVTDAAPLRQSAPLDVPSVRNDTVVIADPRDRQSVASPTAALMAANNTANPPQIALRGARSPSNETAATSGSSRGLPVEPGAVPPMVATNVGSPGQASPSGQPSAFRQSEEDDLVPAAPRADTPKASQPAQATVAPVSATTPSGSVNVVDLADLGDRLVHEAQGFGASAVQTTTALAASPVKELRLKLEPAHLGAVAVTLKMTSGKLSVDVGVASPDALVAVECQRDTMIAKLQTGVPSLDSFVVHQQIFSGATFSQTSSNPAQAESFGNTSANDKSSPGAEDRTSRQPRTPSTEAPPPARDRLGDGLVV